MIYTKCKCDHNIVSLETAQEMQQRIQTLEKRVYEQRKVNAGLHRTCDAHAKLLLAMDREYRGGSEVEEALIDRLLETIGLSKTAQLQEMRKFLANIRKEE